uniref:Dihydrodipicolinate synthase n=1 Tax=Anthurium amnicola TaxID=1678845 RepID=A0A1D1Y945_9ARAE
MQVTHFLDGNGVSTEKIDEQPMLNGEGDHVIVNSEEISVPNRSNSSASSSSLDSSSDEDFIQFDATELNRSLTGNGHIPRSNSKLPPDAGENAQLASDVHTQHGEMAGPNTISPRSEAENTDESSPFGVKQSPPTQVMVRPDGLDPYRIPSSVFEGSKPKSPIEWSVASNESLFSIHDGNSSSSRDHVFLLGRSGELPNFSISPPDGYSPTPMVLHPEPKNLDMGNDLEQAVTTEAANAEAMKDVLMAAADVHFDIKKPPMGNNHHSASTSRHSDASNQSFAFPILMNGRDNSVKQPQTQQQVKTEDHKDAPDDVVPDSTQRNWFSCCSCSFC